MASIFCHPKIAPELLSHLEISKQLHNKLVRKALRLCVEYGSIGKFSDNVRKNFVLPPPPSLTTPNIFTPTLQYAITTSINYLMRSLVSSDPEMK